MDLHAILLALVARLTLTQRNLPPLKLASVEAADQDVHLLSLFGIASDRQHLLHAVHVHC